MRPIAAFICSVALALSPLTSASAHALLMTAKPGVGAKHVKPPDEISLEFSEGVEPAVSTITLVNARKETVALGPLHHSGSARTLVADTMSELPSGVYTVKWRAVSVDGHVTSGDFQFDVGG